MYNKVNCKNCNSQRDNDLTHSCEVCGSKKYFLIGYRYAQEARNLYIMIGIVLAVFIIAVLSGAAFLIITQLQL